MKLNPTLRDDADVAKIIEAIMNVADKWHEPDRDLIHALANLCFATGSAHGTKTACATFERLVKGT